MSQLTTLPPQFRADRSGLPGSPAADVSFVLCVESGPLEAQTVLAAESLRRWGGPFSTCPVLAITPRKGFPLTRATREAFDRLGVEWHGFEADHGATWYGPMNKPAALARAEEMVTTEVVAWLDSDVLVVGAPSALHLDPGFDFAALPGSCRYDLGSDGDNEHESFWMATLEHFGIAPERYPMVPGQPGEDRPIRMYWQGGAFAYRRDTGLGKAHLEWSERVLRSRIASKACGTYFTEQVGLALAVSENSLRWQALDPRLNRAFNSLLDELPGSEALAETEVIHYFGSLWPETFPVFLSAVEEVRPDVASWLSQKGPLVDERPLAQRAVHRLNRLLARRRSRRHLAGCRPY